MSAVTPLAPGSWSGLRRGSRIAGVHHLVRKPCNVLRAGTSPPAVHPHDGAVPRRHVWVWYVDEQSGGPGGDQKHQGRLSARRTCLWGESEAWDPWASHAQAWGQGPTPTTILCLLRGRRLSPELASESEAPAGK